LGKSQRKPGRHHLGLSYSAANIALQAPNAHRELQGASLVSEEATIRQAS